MAAIVLCVVDSLNEFLTNNNNNNNNNNHNNNNNNNNNGNFICLRIQL